MVNEKVGVVCHMTSFPVCMCAVLMGEDRGGVEALLCWDARTSRPFNPLISGNDYICTKSFASS